MGIQPSVRPGIQNLVSSVCPLFLNFETAQFHRGIVVIGRTIVTNARVFRHLRGSQDLLFAH